MTKITSAVSPIRVGNSSTDRRTIYTAIEVTETENTDGKPIYKSKIIRYLNSRLEGALVIAEGTTENPGIFTPTQFATVEEKKFLQGNGVLIKTLKQQVNSIKKQFGRSPITAQQKEELSKIASGAAREIIGPQGDQQGGRTSRGSNNPSIPLVGSRDTGGGGADRSSYPTLKYPETMNANQDKLKISVLKFSPKKFQGLGFGGRTQWKGRSIGSVTLPVPNSVTDANNCSWGQDTMNAAQIASSQIAMDTIQKGAEGGLSATEKAIAAGKADVGGVKDAVAQYFVGQATGVKSILARTKGQVINPNLELVFGGPQLRPFNFTFKMSPRDENESIIIRKIIRLFKQSMAVKRSESQLFLKAPNTYKLQFIRGASRSEHQFLPLIKECAMTGFNVNYTPDGNYATYRNSAMVAVELTFSFQELEPIFNSDYQNDGDSSIGF
tara:strand:+ start:87 stop:1406 length:1320 start_codon:yes stop_codon:yes gene_type:complete